MYITKFYSSAKYGVIEANYMYNKHTADAKIIWLGISLSLLFSDMVSVHSGGIGPNEAVCLPPMV